jgi:probable rRNA maturation factor
MHPTPRIEVARALRGAIDDAALRLLARRVRLAARRMGVRAEQLGELGIRIVDDREMADLHLRYMGEAGPTDVLSFGGASEGALAGDDDDEDELAPWVPAASFGDLALDWPQVLRQARVPTRRGVLDEASVLLVHGLAHLLGHDHRTREEARRMHALECVGLRALRIADPPRPYTRSF